MDLEKVYMDYAVLYCREDPPPTGIPFPNHVAPFKIDNRVPTEAEVETAVCRLRLNRAGVHMHLRSEQFNTWLREAYPAKETPPYPNQRNR